MTADIHGQYDKLLDLLIHLDYAEINGVWSHKTHKAIFVGDLIDNKHDESGISHIKTVQLVKSMVEAGGQLYVSSVTMNLMPLLGLLQTQKS
jgi:hypothetical protein